MIPDAQTGRRPRPPLRDEDLAYLSPARFERLNRLGRYTFPRAVEVQPNGFRPLHTHSQ